MKILIVGTGIAGPTLAHWLAKYGFEPTLVERSPSLRTGGYIIDFWGAAFDVAERMGLVERLERTGYHVQELRIVDGDGRRVGGFDASVFSRLTGGRYVSLARSALSEAIYDTLDARTERIFGLSPTSLVETDSGPSGGVEVTFDDGSRRVFDLVIGADGLHSRVRELTFGPEAQFEKFLGYEVAAFEAQGYPHRDTDVYLMYTQKGRQVARFSLRDDRTLFLFIWASSDAAAPPQDIEQQRARISERFEDSGWEVPEILKRLPEVDELYLDRVSQIHMPSWTRSRVALVGDAAHCVSLLAGQGAALAMIGANVLAGELHLAKGDHAQAFERYQARLRDFMSHKQRAAERFAGAFAPRTTLGLFLRNQISKALRLPYVADRALSADLRDAIELPHYDAAS